MGCDYSYGEKYSWCLVSEDFHIACLVKLVLLTDPKISISLYTKDYIDCVSSGLEFVGINSVKLKVYLLEEILWDESPFLVKRVT